MVETVCGSLFIVAAPSGGGKTSLVKQLVNELSQIEVSISHTTRRKRPSERDGVDYYFIDEKTFADKIQAEEFIEHAQVFNHYYGTSKLQIAQRLQSGIDVVLDIDWQGAQQIKRSFKDAVGIFIIPPSLSALKQRLQHRREDDDAVIRDRMQRAQDELSHYAEFDYMIVNDEFEKAAKELQAIVIANRLSIQRQIARQANLLSFLLTSQ